MFHPSAAIGNSHSLATFGPTGEIMGFYYPHIDFARNVREGMFALHLATGGEGRLLWCFDDGWICGQSLKRGTDVLVTRLDHQALDLHVTLTDVMVPQTTALVRHFRIEHGRGCPSVKLYQYLNLAPGDVGRRNAVQHLEDQRVVVQQFRDIVLAVGASKPFAVLCGNVERGGDSGVKRAMAAGRLDSGGQCMGDVDFAIGFALGEGGPWETSLVLAGAASRATAAEIVAKLSATPFAELERADAACRADLLQSVPACNAVEFEEHYERAVISLVDLFDESAGTWIAAPECDPHYAYSGGYGYCWPRDAAKCALIASEIGLVGHARRFFDFCKKTQLEDGHWYQRYWVTGTEAPSWCVRHDELQLDQTCAVLRAAARFAGALGSERQNWIADFLPMAQRAAQAVIGHIGDDGLHKQAADLWECCYGSFTYTGAAVIAALREACAVFGIQVPDTQRLLRVLIDRLFVEKTRRWARRISPDGSLDETVDSSALGLIEPWNVLDLSDPTHRDLALRTVESIDEVLGLDMPRGRVLLRFEGEQYMGGAAGCVNTLWLAQCRLRIAKVLLGEDRSRQIELARRSIRAALAYANPVGQLPELIPRDGRVGYWAAPHGWASSLLISCVLQLNGLEGSSSGARPARAATCT